jgi:hypothetical protein
VPALPFSPLILLSYLLLARFATASLGHCYREPGQDPDQFKRAVLVVLVRSSQSCWSHVFEFATQRLNRSRDLMLGSAASACCSLSVLSLGRNLKGYNIRGLGRTRRRPR